LRNKKVVKDIGSWESFAYYSLHRRKLEMYQRISRDSLSSSSNGESDKDEKKPESKNPFKDIKRKFEVLLDSNKNNKTGDDPLKAIIIDEINGYMSKLKFNQNLRSQILLEVAKK
jgi:hypothetical protein